MEYWRVFERRLSRWFGSWSVCAWQTVFISSLFWTNFISWTVFCFWISDYQNIIGSGIHGLPGFGSEAHLFSFFPDSFPFFNRFFSTVKFFPLYKIWSLYFWMIKIIFTLRLLILFSYWRLLQYQTKKIRIKKIVEPAPRPPNIVTVERLCAAM